jgi:hypothetical protein
MSPSTASTAARRTLLVVVAAALVAGCLRRRDTVSPEPEVFMWVGGTQVMDARPALFRSMLQFAARHGIVPYASGVRDTTGLRRYLEACRAAGIERVWIEIGPRSGATAREFATDPEARAPTLERFRRLARVLREHDPAEARVTVFDEAPLGAFASAPTDSGRSYRADVRAFRQHGPQGFAQMFDALKAEMPAVEVGVFLHHPHNASPATAGENAFLDAFMADAQEQGAAPDFVFSDLYRGYFNRGYGVEATNAYVTDVVRHANDVAAEYGATSYHLGQVHTIKLGYTPSRRQIDTNVEAILEGDPNGVGWYWPNYASPDRARGPDGTPARPTGYDVAFDPFDPNSWGRLGPAGSLYGTSRDRFSYAYLRLLEATGRLEPDRRFDLWVYGHDFDHAEHDVYLQPAGAEGEADSTWTYVGTVNPQRDADGYVPGARREHMHSYDGRWHAVVFHGLRRSRYMTRPQNETAVSADSTRLRVRITTPRESDTSRLAAVYAMPYRATRNYALEEEVTRFVAEQPRWTAVNSLARHVRLAPQPLTPDSAFTGVLLGPRSRPVRPADWGGGNAGR